MSKKSVLSQNIPLSTKAVSLAVNTLNGVLAALGIGGLFVVVRIFGWPVGIEGETLLYAATGTILLLFGVCELALLALARHRLVHLRENPLSIAAALVALGISIGAGRISGKLVELLGGRNLSFVLLAFIVVSQAAVLFPLMIQWMRHWRRTWMTMVQPRTLVIGSFMTLILGGALLLMTPNATHGGISWLDAVFTSASAVCVTGLIVVDTATAFTLHGQFVILVLMQIGGLGLMTFAFFLAMLSGEGISLHDRVMLRDVISERNMGFISRVLPEMVLVTGLFEAAGAVLIWFQLQDCSLPGGPVWWHSVFHAVSAFCNAGFSTLSGNLADPLVVHMRGIQATVMVLVICGGLGFPVLRELRGRFLSWVFPRHFERKVHMSLHSRIVIRMTVLLLVGGTVLLYACQYAQPSGVEPSLWRAAFDSVTARTAGFNIADVGSYSVPVLLVMMVLMFVGGSPSGTAGGVKTTTVALALLNLWTTVREKREIQVGRRSVSQRTANLAFAAMVISLVWLALASFAMSVAEPSMSFIDLLFETVSAFGTVGLSRGITSSLGIPAKLILVVTMFIGRIGLIVIASALLHSRRDTRYNLPKEDVPLT